MFGTVSFGLDILMCGQQKNFEITHVLGAEHLQWNEDPSALRMKHLEQEESLVPVHTDLMTFKNSWSSMYMHPVIRFRIWAEKSGSFTADIIADTERLAKTASKAVFRLKRALYLHPVHPISGCFCSIDLTKLLSVIVRYTKLDASLLPLMISTFRFKISCNILVVQKIKKNKIVTSTCSSKKNAI